MTAPAGTMGTCVNVWTVVQADMDGDGFFESYPAPLANGGCWMSIYQFDAYGFRVTAHNDQIINWTTQANATVTYFSEK